MKCANCGIEYDDALDACPECGSPCPDGALADTGVLAACPQEDVAGGQEETSSDSKEDEVAIDPVDEQVIDEFDEEGELLEDDPDESKLDEVGKEEMDEEVVEPPVDESEDTDESEPEEADEPGAEEDEEQDEEQESEDLEGSDAEGRDEEDGDETVEAESEEAEDQEAEEEPLEDEQEESEAFEMGDAPDDLIALSPESLVGMESISVLTSSGGMLGLQRQCPRCGAVIYSGMRRCTRCGRLVDPEAEKEATAAVGEPKVRKRSQIKQVLGIIALILGLLLVGWFVALAIPGAYESMTAFTPNLVETESIDGEIDEILREKNGGEEADAVPEEESEPEIELSIETFATDWAGTIRDSSPLTDNGAILRAVAFTFQGVWEDGTLAGVCDVGIADEGPGAATGTYYVGGTINWETGDIELYGTEWIDPGDLNHMLVYQGTVDVEAGSITGTVHEEDGEYVGPWTMNVVVQEEEATEE